jgi:hypothetical protein
MLAGRPEGRVKGAEVRQRRGRRCEPVDSGPVRPLLARAEISDLLVQLADDLDEHLDEVGHRAARAVPVYWRCTPTV